MNDNDMIAYTVLTKEVMELTLQWVVLSLQGATLTGCFTTHLGVRFPSEGFYGAAPPG